MATILVTGGAGFIGSNLCSSLLGEGHAVVAVDNLITGERANVDALSAHSNFMFREADITDPRLSALLDMHSFTHVYHLACPTGVPNLKTLGEEMLATCSLGMFNVLNIARQHGAKVLFTSTAEAYGQPEVTPQTEEYNGNVSTTGERSPYEEGKRFSESVLAMYVRKYGLDARIVRVFNTYGPGMSLRDTRVIPQFLQCVLDGEPLRIYGDGSQTRCHLYIDDLVAGLELVMEKGVPGEIYNVGSDHEMSVRELAKLIIERTGHSAGIECVPHFIEDHKQRRPSVEKARALGWQKLVHIEDGLQRMIAHLKPASAKNKEDVVAGEALVPAAA